MPEILLHYIWYKELYSSFEQSTVDGQKIEIISPGEHNTDAGPDFTGARIRFFSSDDDTFFDLVGNVEIHINSSDWNKHQHNINPIYDNIILHVVKNADKKIYNSIGQEITQCELQYTTEKDYLSSLIADAQKMDSALFQHLCGNYLSSNPDLLTSDWRKILCVHRLECKKRSIQQLLEITQDDQEWAFYITLSHNFGFHINSLPFEELAIATPLPVIQKHRTNIFQLVAILLGQAGMLYPNISVNAIFNDNISHLLYNEYSKWKNVYNLKSISPHLWKHARIHPNNFPQIRIIQFAQLLQKSASLLNDILSSPDIEQIIALFNNISHSDNSPFEHFIQSIPRLGREGIKTLLINTAVPYKYAFKQENTAFEWLQNLPSENNSIIRQWKFLGQVVKTAADSQALIHLYTTYCQPHKCLQCDVAYQIFVNNNN